VSVFRQRRSPGPSGQSLPARRNRACRLTDASRSWTVCERTTLPALGRGPRSPVSRCVHPCLRGVWFFTSPWPRPRKTQPGTPRLPVSHAESRATGNDSDKPTSFCFLTELVRTSHSSKNNCPTNPASTCEGSVMHNQGENLGTVRGTASRSETAPGCNILSRHEKRFIQPDSRETPQQFRCGFLLDAQRCKCHTRLAISGYS